MNKPTTNKLTKTEETSSVHKHKQNFTTTPIHCHATITITNCFFWSIIFHYLILFASLSSFPPHFTYTNLFLPVSPLKSSSWRSLNTKHFREWGRNAKTKWKSLAHTCHEGFLLLTVKFHLSACAFSNSLQWVVGSGRVQRDVLCKRKKITCIRGCKKLFYFFRAPVSCIFKGQKLLHTLSWIFFSPHARHYWPLLQRAPQLPKRYSLMLKRMARNLAALLWVCTAKTFPRLSKTFELCALAKRALATKANLCTTRDPRSTEWFPISCCKEEISPTATAEVENLFMETNLKMKISNSNTLAHMYFQWPTLGMCYWYTEA